MQTSLLPVFVENEFDSTFEGNDLKRMALGTDGRTYAMKRLADHAALPICEWVSYHLCAAVAIPTPDFAILRYRDESEPSAFGSRIVDGSRQVNHNPGSYEISAFFGSHLASLSRIYALDAFVTNSDRHGRNVLVAEFSGRPSLLAFDFSRAWLRLGAPFGNTEALRDSHTERWWRTFKRLGAATDTQLLDRIEALPDDWLHSVTASAPQEWAAGVDLQAALEYWQRRRERVDFAKRWL